MDINKFIKIWLLEFIQNAPLFFAFSRGFELLEAGEIGMAVGVVTAFVSFGVLLIRYTEQLINRLEIEAWRVTLTNFLFFTAAILLVAVYFSWIRANAFTDFATGFTLGLLLCKAQSISSREQMSKRHALALSIASGAAMLLIRWIGGLYSPITASILINLPVTTIIVWIDYSKFFQRTE